MKKTQKMDDKERQREIDELDAAFGVEFELFDTKHILEHWDPRRYTLNLLNEMYGDEYYFPDTKDKLKKMDRMFGGIKPDGKEHIDYMNELGLPLVYMEWDIEETQEEEDGDDENPIANT